MKRSVSVCLLIASLAGIAIGCQAVATPSSLDAGYDLGGRRIRVAVDEDYPPFASLDREAGVLAGWDIDACNAICELLNCEPELVGTDLSRRALVEAVAGGEYDMAAAGLVITDERQAQVDFSVPYMAVQQVIVVRTEEAGIVDVGSLLASGGFVAVRLNSVSEYVVAELIDPERMRRFGSSYLCIEALVTGEVDAVVAGGSEARALAEEYAGAVKVLDAAPILEERMGFAFPRGSELVAPINYAVQVLEMRGVLDQLFEAWWGQPR